MGISTRASFIKGRAMEVGFIITSPMEDMKAIGSTADTMGMELRAGREGADTGGSTGRACGMDLGFIGSTQAILMQGNGLRDRAMGLGFKPALMVAAMWGSSSMAPSMALAVTILGESLCCLVYHMICGGCSIQCL